MKLSGLMLIAGTLLLLAACGTTPPPEASVGFEVGQVHVVTRPLSIARSGERLVLVPSPFRSGFENEMVLAVGTRVRVVAIQEDNTLTHGKDIWPEGLILTGPHAGQRVSLGHPELASHLEPVSQ